MLKRLIEVALPLKEVSEQSVRQKSIGRGNISTLHFWWARRPLAACRAVVFASLIPDPDDPECPDRFRALVMETLGRTEFKPKNGDGSVIEDTPRNRCLEFIKQLVERENSNNPMYIEPARELIAAAHKFLHPNTESDVPQVLDPFAGGGAIPLEALRLGCEAHAVDINPVAHLIELCTLVYPQKYGQPNSRSVPKYIRQLISHNKAKKRARGERGLFDKGETQPPSDANEIIPNVDITEEEYCKNPLAADVRYWGHWALENARRRIERFYPSADDGSVPIVYIWARTVECPNPTCSATIPLMRSLSLSKRAGSHVAMRMETDETSMTCVFAIVTGTEIDFDVKLGTIQHGNASCPFCSQVAPVQYLRESFRAGRIAQQLVAVVCDNPTQGRVYRSPTQKDIGAFEEAEQLISTMRENDPEHRIPNEPLPPVGTLGFRVNNYGMTQWGHLFNARQLLALTTFVESISSSVTVMQGAKLPFDYAHAVVTVVATNFGRAPDHWATLCAWNPSGPKLQHIFGRQALPMVWDYAEANPFGGSVGDYESSILWNGWNAVTGASGTSDIPATVRQASATALPYQDGIAAAVITDPPYYDAVPYADLSDFFYVWHKRTLGKIHSDVLRTPLTPKRQELISYGLSGHPTNDKNPEWYESGMENAFSQMKRVTTAEGIIAVMFAHKTTAAWERLIAGLNRQGLIVTASWPFHTEMKTRLRAMASAALASSVTLVCRKRTENVGPGLWDDVRQELKSVAQERLDFFWDQGIRGADFFISAIGPALSVFGKYERVTKLSGEEVTVGQFLDEVRSLVTSYALAKILKTTHTGTIDPESRFYVVWKWSYGGSKVPADESFKLSQALGFDTASLWDRTGVLEKSGENVQASAISERIKVKNLGEPSADGTPASLIDVLHRMCAFREKGDTQGMGEFLARSGHANNNSLWLVAQAISETLPDGDKEKQLMQGLLNQKEGLEEAARERRLF